MTVRFFTVYRPAAPDTHDANQKNAPEAPQFEGVIFSDGTCALRWLTACRSTSMWASFDDAIKIHGHPEYGTRVEWYSNEERRVLERAIDRMGWDEINAYDTEMRKGQGICEDAGGYVLRGLRRLFGLPGKDEEIVTYQQAARAMLKDTGYPG